MDRYDELLAQVLNGPPEVERPKARRRRRRAAASRGSADGVDPKKRRLSEEQVELMELSFREERKLESGRKVQLAAELGLDPKQVAVWFQNRRARHKSKLLEEEFGRLKCAHDATVVHNCHLENEVLMLKERLMVAEEEVTKLKSAGAHAVCGDGSPRPSFSPDACMATDHAGGGGVPDDLMYVPDYGYDSSIMEWCSLYGLM